MLYRFHSKNSADCFMLKDLTLRIFELIDRSLDERGIFLVEQLPELILKLETAIQKDADLRRNLSAADEKKSPVPDRLGQRANPFLNLLKSALKYQDPIVWGD